MDLLVAAAASTAPPWCWSPTTPGSPPTPTARSSSATARSARSPGASHDLPRPAPGGQRRPRGGRPAGDPHRRGRPRRRPAADAVAATNASVTWNNHHAWFWTGTASVPAAPAAAPPRCGGTPAATSSTASRSSASTWPPRRLVAGAARPPPRPGAGHVLRLARAGRADAQHAGERARRPLPRPPGGPIGDAALPSPTRWSSSSGAPRRSWRHADPVRVTSIADAMPGASCQTSASAGCPPRRTPGAGLFPVRRRRAARTPSTSSCRRGAGDPDPGADLHRHRDPAVGRPPRGAVRGDAPGRRPAGRSR